MLIRLALRPSTSKTSPCVIPGTLRVSVAKTLPFSLSPKITFSEFVRWRFITNHVTRAPVIEIPFFFDLIYKDNLVHCRLSPLPPCLLICSIKSSVASYVTHLSTILGPYRPLSFFLMNMRRIFFFLLRMSRHLWRVFFLLFIHHIYF